MISGGGKLIQFVNKNLANTVTLGNIVFGSLSLAATMANHFYLAAICILGAVVMDTMDGRVARHFDIVSEIGKELDSLCDLVSFGVAPAMLVYQTKLVSLPLLAGVLLMLLYILCGAFRLARFNVLNIPDYFVGVPITFAGIIMALMTLFYKGTSVSLSAFIMALLALLMISPFKVRKLK